MKKVKKLETLIDLAVKKKSVMLPKHMSQRPWPAAFVINMNLMYVYHLLAQGIYIYKPKKRK